MKQHEEVVVDLAVENPIPVATEAIRSPMLAKYSVVMSTHLCLFLISESVAITTKQLPRDEQMKDTFETRDFASEEMLGPGLSEDELTN